MPNDIQSLIKEIRKNEESTNKDIHEMREALKDMAKSIGQYFQHRAVLEEERKHDAEFKKEVRIFMKESVPIITKAKDAQESRAKITIAVTSFLLLGILAAYVKF